MKTTTFTVLMVIALTSCQKEEKELPDIDYSKNYIEIINQIRTEYVCCKPVRFDSVCYKLALFQAEYMDSTGDYNHVRKSGMTVRQRAWLFGLDDAAENIARGYKTESAVMEAWVNSEGHLYNMCMPYLTKVAVARKNNYWVMILTF